MVILPVYKYSEFNYGIGALDSFPSIIKKETKSMINWQVDSEKLKKCKKLNYDLSDNFHRIYISLIFKTLSLHYTDGSFNCNIKQNNKNFVINFI